jgi:hypothetical protein
MARASSALTKALPDGLLPVSDTQLLRVENCFARPGLQRLMRVDLDAQ